MSGERSTKGVYAWELGSGHGHVQLFSPLAKALKALGCDLHCYVQNPGVAQAAGLRAFQAPRFFAMPAANGVVGHAEILLSSGGFADETNLDSLIRAWLSIFDHVQPQFVIGDYAPGAMLAARLVGIPRFTYDTGFFTAPLDAPLPVLDDETPELLERIRVSETSLLRIVNNVIARWGGCSFEDVRELFRSDGPYFSQHAELDVFRRQLGTFTGSFVNTGVLSSSRHTRIQDIHAFVYLNAHFPVTVISMRILVQSGLRITAYIANARGVADALGNPSNLVVLDEPADMHEMLQSVDFVMCHAGVGTIHHALAYGKPLLLLPNYYEQWLNASRVEERGLGKLVTIGKQSELDAELPGFLDDLGRIRTNCEHFVARNPPADPLVIANDILQEVAQHSLTRADVLPIAIGRVGLAPRPIRFCDLDVVFISSDETNAHKHFLALQEARPDALRVEAVMDSAEAIAAAAAIAKTERFIVVNADCLLDPSFFDIETMPPPNMSQSTWVWSSRNAINALGYEHGGVAIWSRDMVSKREVHKRAKAPYSFTEHAGYACLGKIFSTNKPNGSPQQAFRTAFRETVRLGRMSDGSTLPAGTMHRMIRMLNVRRRIVWMSVGADVEYGRWAILGARIGCEQGSQEDFCMERLDDPGWLDSHWQRFAHLVTGDDAAMDDTIREVGERLRVQHNMQVLEEWSPERSRVFKAELTRRVRDCGLFDRNGEGL